MYLDYGGEATWKDAVAFALVIAAGAFGFYGELASRYSEPIVAYNTSGGGGIVGDYRMIAEDCNGYASEAAFGGSPEAKVHGGTWCRIVGRGGVSKTKVRLNNGRKLWVASEWIQ